MEGAAGFAKNANEFFFDTSDDGFAETTRINARGKDCYIVFIGYDSDFNRQIIATYGVGEYIPQAIYRQNYFTIVIRIDKSFECMVYNFKGSVLFESGKFYSRYDL